MKTATEKKITAQDIFKKTEKAENLSPILKALETAHEMIRAEIDAPRATIVITRNTKGKLAHWTNYTAWQSGEQSFNEILFNAEFFYQGAEKVLSVLLHEMAHSINFKNGENGCSAEQYHNKVFAKRATELGLNPQKMGRFGLADTPLTPAGLARWQKAHDIIKDALAISALTENSKKSKGRNKNLGVAICPNCGEKIRLSRKAFENCQPICGACSVNFKMEDDGEESGEE